MRCGRSVADPPDDSVIVEAMFEVAERLSVLLDGAESMQPEQLPLRGADKSLDAAVALGLADEGRARLDAEGLELVLKGMRDRLASLVVAVTCPPKTDPSAMRVPTGPGWALETLDETDTTHP